LSGGTCVALHVLAMAIEAGRVIRSFALRRKLADGGMGSIWVAWHGTLQREVAVKFLAKCPPDDVESAQRFTLEARIEAGIRSPHVPQVFEHGTTEEGIPFLVMALLQGVDLATWMEKYGRLPLTQVVRIVEQVGLALSAAHEVGIIHRDVKPTNIILDASGAHPHAYLIDFGIAKSTHSSTRPLTHPGTTIGTPSYMSPEQLMGVGCVDERADVWSLGVVAYLCLTGRLPFAGDTIRELSFSVYAGRFAPASTLRAGLPESIDAWFGEALSRDLEGRFRTVDMMTGRLRAAVADAGSLSPGSGPRSRPRTTLRDNLSASSGSGCVVPRREPSRRTGRRAMMVCAVGSALVGAVAAYLISLTAGPAAARSLQTPAAALGQASVPNRAAGPFADEVPDAGGRAAPRSNGL
jgi:serine/threonine protein kinase